MIWEIVASQKIIYAEPLNPFVVLYLLYFQAPQCCELYTTGSVNWSHRRQSRSSVWARDPEQTSRFAWRRSWFLRSAAVSTVVGLFYHEQKAKAKATSLLEFLFGNAMCCSYLVTTIIQRARMHSSRMRTVRCSYRLGGCLPGGVSSQWGEGCLPVGVCLPKGEGVMPCGMYIPRPRVRNPPLWTEFLTHTCENITFL